MISSRGKNRLRSIPLLALTLGFPLAAEGRADEADPTAPSPQISALLDGAHSVPTALEVTKQLATSNVELPKLRIKAMVLRDKEHGSALIAVGEDEIRMLPLGPTSPTTPAYQLKLGEAFFQIEHFTSTSIHLRHLHSPAVVIVH